MTLTVEMLKKTICPGNVESTSLFSFAHQEPKKNRHCIAVQYRIVYKQELHGDVLNFEKKTESPFKVALYDRIIMLEFLAGILNYKAVTTSETRFYL
ncbi:hypothetical protein BPOR_0205g00150 [Botrytis porri]|uniref:Uncharacterized protein n=1 Tax=Botrytis porri TaxID=87229 RepID=A0A4Z1KQ48_9HELO|nr:hypothetical protein BPOR_0205g00150 [Botrytis porri]